MDRLGYCLGDCSGTAVLAPSFDVTITRLISALSVRPRGSSTQTKLSEHEANRGEAEKDKGVEAEVFEILGQPAAAIEPSESALDNPTSRQKRKPFGLVGAVDDFDLDVWQDFG